MQVAVIIDKGLHHALRGKRRNISAAWNLAGSLSIRDEVLRAQSAKFSVLRSAGTEILEYRYTAIRLC